MERACTPESDGIQAPPQSCAVLDRSLSLSTSLFPYQGNREHLFHWDIAGIVRDRTVARWRSVRAEKRRRQQGWQ